MPSLNSTPRREYHPRLFFLILIIGIFAPQVAMSQLSDPPDQSPSTPVTSVVPEQDALINIIVNGEEFYDVEAKYDGSSPFVKKSILADFMTKYLMPTEYNRLFTALFKDVEYLGASDLETAGIQSQWNEAGLTFEIVIPTEMSTRVEIDFGGKPPAVDLTAYPNAKISSAINASSSIEADFSASTSNLSFSVDLDGLLKVWELAVEGAGSVRLSDFTLSSSIYKANAVIDLPKLGGRLLVGKVNSEGMSFQTRTELLGLSINSVDVFSRYDRISSPAIAFELERSSTIKILINDLPVRTMNLTRGRYRIYDLPFSAGLNTITIQMADSTGDEKWFQPILPYIAAESGILVGGQNEFGATAGVGYKEPTEPFASAFFRYGLDYRVTLSAFSQIDMRSILAGGALIAGTSIGIFSTETAANFAWDGRQYPFSVAANVRYRINFPARPWFPNINFSAEYRSLGFALPSPTSTVTAPADATINAATSISGTIIDNVWYSSSLNWERSVSSPIKDTFRTALSLGFVPNNNTSFVMSAGMTLQPANAPKFDITVLANITPVRNSNAHISLEQGGEGTNSIEYAQVLPILGGTDFSIRGTNLIGGVSQRTSLTSSLRKPGSIGEATLKGAIAFGGNSASYDASFNLTGRTAIAFADGIFALSRSLTDSFVIVVPEDEAKKEKINFSTTASGSVTTKGFPRALSLSSYRTNTARTDFPEADANIIATVPEIILYPRYRSGIVFRVDIKKETAITGRLVDSAQKAYAYVVGDIFKLEDNAPVGSVFTYEDGTFVVYALPSGEYRIEWPAGIGSSNIQIPEGIGEGFDLGDITAVSARE